MVFTKYHSDCVEFCPFSSSVFACGNYELDEQNKKKNGAIYLFHTDLQQQQHATDEEVVDIEELQFTETGAILDLKWSWKSFDFGTSHAVLGAVDADGVLSLYSSELERLKKSKKADDLIKLKAQVQLNKSNKPSCLGLSLDWNNRFVRFEFSSWTISR